MNNIVIFHPAGIGDCILDISNLYQLINSNCAPNKFKYVCNINAKPVIKYSGLDKYLDIYYLKYPVISINDFFTLYGVKQKNQKIFVLGGMNLKRVAYLKHLWPNQVEFYGVLQNFPQECLTKITPNDKTYSYVEGPFSNSHRIVENFKLLRSQGLLENSDFLIKGLDKGIISKFKDSSLNNYYIKPYIVVHTGHLGNLNNEKKTMNIESWKKLLASLINHIDEKIIILGTSRESKFVESIISFFNKDKIISICGKTSLTQAISLIERSEMVLAIDGAISHLAASMGKNLITIFGPTDPNATSPVGTNGFIIRQKMDCSPCYWSENYQICPYNRECLNSLDYPVLAEFIIQFLSDGYCIENPTIVGCEITNIPAFDILQKQLNY